MVISIKGHIQVGSTLIHDKEKAHKKLVSELALKSVCYASNDTKGLADSENPLDPVNRIHCLLKMFLNAHSGFSRDDLQNYLNLYAFVINQLITLRKLKKSSKWFLKIPNHCAIVINSANLCKFHTPYASRNFKVIICRSYKLSFIGYIFPNSAADNKPLSAAPCVMSQSPITSV